MKTFLWILGVGTLGVAAYIVFANNQLDRAPGRSDVDDAGEQVGSWGTKQRVRGTGGQVGGKLKQGVGKVMGDKSLEGSGLVDQATGAVKDAAGQAAHAVQDTIQDLNK